jgi:hypothetical protein
MTYNSNQHPISAADFAEQNVTRFEFHESLKQVRAKRRFVKQRAIKKFSNTKFAVATTLLSIVKLTREFPLL